MEPVIACEHLTHYYGSRKIYEDLNFEISPGHIVGLLGKNGTGKTTTINILMGYLTPTSGSCRIFGEESHCISPKTRERIALLLEGHVQYSYMTISQIGKFYSSFYPKWDKDAYYGLMEKLKVAPGQKISRMSNGQRSQVSLGLILAQNADLLVLDDFSLGLDPGYRRLFCEYLRDYVKARGKTVFLTSHIIPDLFYFNPWPDAFDSGWTYCGEFDGDTSRFGKSVRRAVKEGKLVDTNNSTNDFTPNASPSLAK